MFLIQRKNARATRDWQTDEGARAGANNRTLLIVPGKEAGKLTKLLWREERVERCFGAEIRYCVYACNYACNYSLIDARVRSIAWEDALRASEASAKG